MSDQIEETEVQERGCGPERDDGALYMTSRMGKLGVPITEFFIDPFDFGNGTALAPDAVRLLAGEGSQGVRIIDRPDGSKIIIDVVGAENYTAASFLEELKHLGPSRKIAKDVAFSLAKHVQNGGKFDWFFVYKKCLPEPLYWEKVNEMRERCSLGRHPIASDMEDGKLCSQILYEQDEIVNEFRAYTCRETAAGRSYTTWEKAFRFNTPCSAVIAIIPSDFMKIESVVFSDGSVNPDHKDLEQFDIFGYVTE